MPPSEYGDFPGALRGYRRQKNKARRPCSYRTAHGQAHSSSFLYLKTLAVIQRNPARATLEFPPSCGGTRAGFHLCNRKHAFPCILADLGVIRTGTFADIQIRCCDLYQEGTGGTSRASLLSSVNYLPTFIINGIACIGVSTSLGVIQIVESSLLALGIRPAFADTV